MSFLQDAEVEEIRIPEEDIPRVLASVMHRVNQITTLMRWDFEARFDDEDPAVYRKRWMAASIFDILLTIVMVILVFLAFVASWVSYVEEIAEPNVRMTYVQRSVPMNLPAMFICLSQRKNCTYSGLTVRGDMVDGAFEDVYYMDTTSGTPVPTKEPALTLLNRTIDVEGFREPRHMQCVIANPYQKTPMRKTDHQVFFDVITEFDQDPTVCDLAVLPMYVHFTNTIDDLKLLPPPYGPIEDAPSATNIDLVIPKSLKALEPTEWYPLRQGVTNVGKMIESVQTRSMTVELFRGPPDFHDRFEADVMQIPLEAIASPGEAYNCHVVPGHPVANMTRCKTRSILLIGKEPQVLNYHEFTTMEPYSPFVDAFSIFCGLGLFKMIVVEVVKHCIRQRGLKRLDEEEQAQIEEETRRQELQKAEAGRKDDSDSDDSDGAKGGGLTKAATLRTRKRVVRQQLLPSHQRFRLPVYRSDAAWIADKPTRDLPSPPQ